MPLLLKWPGISAVNTLLVSLDKNEFGIRSSPVVYAGRTFIPKRELHVTVCGSTLGKRLNQKFLEDPGIEKRVRQAFEDTDWHYEKTRGLRRLVRPQAGNRNPEESIIMLVKMEGMARFYSRLKTLDIIPENHPVPPAHVTLYTYNCELGIGVHSERDLSELTVEQIDSLI